MVVRAGQQVSVMMCDIGKCKRPSILSYAAFGKRTKDVSVCQHHWDKHCNDKDKFDIRLYSMSTHEGRHRVPRRSDVRDGFN